MTDRRTFLAGLPLVLGAVGGCARRAEDGRPVVAVSVPPQAWFVDRLSAGAARPVVMVPPGASPATHEPTINQVRAITRAALYVKVGHPSFPFERAWLDRLVAEAGDLRQVSCVEDQRVRPGDPHVWTSVRLMRRFVPSLAAALGPLLPGPGRDVDARAAALDVELAQLDAELRRRLSDLPRRRFYVFHPSWGYLAHDYGLEQVPIQIGAKEPDPHTLTRTLEAARRDGARTVFVQPQFSRRSAELVAEAIGARVVALDPLARAWADNLRQVGAALAEELAR